MQTVNHAAKRASHFEILAARAWNLLNEGTAFHPIFAACTFLLYHSGGLLSGTLLPLATALAVGAPFVATYVRYDFPLHLRWFLWVPPLLWWLLGGTFPLPLLLLALGLYLFFTIFFWGSLYYHLRIGTPLTNYRRFWRMVLQNSDSTSGNLQEHLPKAALVLSLMEWGYHLPARGWWDVSLGMTGALAVGLFLYAEFLHRLLFTWRPLAPVSSEPPDLPDKGAAKRAYVIVIDGCRPDKLDLAETPFLDRLATVGTRFTRMETAYPARTVVCFSSMLTGAMPTVHGMRSNLVLSLGVKCPSLFDSLRQVEKKGILYACAHLIDAFGSDCRAFTAVGHNDLVDARIMDGAKEIITQERPDLFVLQLIAVDQTGHSLGVHEPEYLQKITETDARIADFHAWLTAQGLLQDAAFIVMADHGQSRGIGGHAHLDEGERYVPFLITGPGIAPGHVVEQPSSILSLAPTLAHLLGVPRPAAAVAPVLAQAFAERQAPVQAEKLLVVMPARNEEATVGAVIASIPRHFLPGLQVEVLVVDDGSIDGTTTVARKAGADYVIPGPACGLGAAVRLALSEARRLGADYTILIDADGEYPPQEIPTLLAPLRLGKADYVLGSRFRGYIRRMRLTRRLGNYVFTLLQSLLLGRWLTDGQTGMRALNRRALASLTLISDYNYAQVMTLNLLRQGMRLSEVPITYAAHPVPGRSFIRFFPYLRHVLSAIWREMHRSPHPSAKAARSMQR